MNTNAIELNRNKMMFVINNGDVVELNVPAIKNIFKSDGKNLKLYCITNDKGDISIVKTNNTPEEILNLENDINSLNDKISKQKDNVDSIKTHNIGVEIANIAILVPAVTLLIATIPTSIAGAIITSILMYIPFKITHRIFFGTRKSRRKNLLKANHLLNNLEEELQNAKKYYTELTKTLDYEKYSVNELTNDQNYLSYNNEPNNINEKIKTIKIGQKK